MSLQGKRVLITGATSGIGQAAAYALAGQGAELTLLCRSPDRAESVADAIEAEHGHRPELLVCDFESLASVRKAAEQYLDSGQPLHVLLNNAGVINTQRMETVEGYEQTFAVNHLAPFLLTGMLLPALQREAGARIVNVASDAHRFCKAIRFNDPQTLGTYRTFEVYGHSKLANILFTRELARRLGYGDPLVNCLHPGAVATGMGTNNPGLLGKILPPLLKPFFRTPEKGAETAIYLCADPGLAGVSGRYFQDCRAVKPKPWAEDDDMAAALWRLSEELVGFSYPEGGPTT